MAIVPDQTTPLKTGPDSLLGIILRVSFFVLIVILGLNVLVPLLFWVFGLVTASTIGLCATGLLANFFNLRVFDRRPFEDIGLKLGVPSAWNLGLGLLMGAGAAALMLAAPLLAGTGHLILQGGSSLSWGSMIFYLAALGVAATGEELIFRGYAFQLLIQKMGPFATILPVSVLFGAMHAFNPHSSGLGMINTGLWGVVLGCGFLRSRDLWLPIGLHYGWNLVLPLFGVNLSGLTIEVTRYSYRWDLSPLWSGGDYGPEGGLLATVFIVGLCFVLFKAPVRPQQAAIARNLNDPALFDSPA